MDFELDWNKYFIEQLINAGYGVANDEEEEIVDLGLETLLGTFWTKKDLTKNADGLY